MSAAVVFGATGFVGRWLVLDLLATTAGPVVAAVRTRESGDRLRRWIAARGADPARLAVHVYDWRAPRIELDPPPPPVRQVHNVTGAFAFGMATDTAREVNVGVAERITRFAADVGARRLVHVTGYRVAAHGGVPAPWSDTHRARVYRRLGAYEASKIEADAVVTDLAARLGVPLTVVNPGTVIGHSETGESGQYVGLAEIVLDVARGRLRAVPGSAGTVLPVVTVDYLARFLTLAAADPAAAGHAYWVLDDETPPLPDLVRLVADDFGVRAPRMRIPVAVLRVLPPRATGAERESLSFLSADRYPTGPAVALARRHGLAFPPVRAALSRWAHHLVETAPA